jgi:hypothetical protein
MKLTERDQQFIKDQVKEIVDVLNELIKEVKTLNKSNIIGPR